MLVQDLKRGDRFVHPLTRNTVTVTAVDTSQAPLIMVLIKDGAPVEIWVNSSVTAYCV